MQTGRSGKACPFAPNPPTRRVRGAEGGPPGRPGWSGADAGPGPAGALPAPGSGAEVSDAGRTPGRAGRGPGSPRSRSGAAPGPRPRDPGRPSADRRPSPEEGVGAVVVDLGLGAAAARGRAVRRLLQRRLAGGHRRPLPRSPGVPALAPPHSSSAPRAAPPRTVTSRTPGHRERAAHGAGSAGKGSRRQPAGSLESGGRGRLGKGGRCIVGLVVRTPGPRGMLALVVSDPRVRSSACWEGCLLVAR